MHRTYKFRLYPDHSQYKNLHKTLGACRWVYNTMVEKIHREGSQSRNDLNYFLAELKESEQWLYSHHSKMLQMISTQVDGAQKSLVQKRKNGYKAGELKFARFSEYHIFTYNQSGFEIKDGFLHLSKIGKIKIIQHRDIPENHTIKQITITSSKTGKWHACVLCEIDAVLPKISLAKSVGIDVGIKNFAYDSDGYQTPNPLNYTKMLKPLRRIQRKIARRQKGSNNHTKALKWYQMVHERIRNRRKDFLHKLSTQYAKKYDIVFVEKLQKLNMVQNHTIARNMPKSLAVRTHRCDVCGLVLDRDHNAAINILKKGLEIFNLSPQAKVPQELRELTPAEIEIGQGSRKRLPALSYSSSLLLVHL